MTNTLCIDPGTIVLGWAVLPDNAKDYTDITSGRYVVKGEVRERVNLIVENLRNMVRSKNVTRVIAEETSTIQQMSVDAKDALATVKTLIKWECQVIGIPFQVVSNSTIKATACNIANVQRGPGERNWKKDHLKKAYQVITGMDPMDDNECDAWGIAMLALHAPEKL